MPILASGHPAITYRNGVDTIMTFDEVEAVCNIVEQMEREAIYQDGSATIPAYLLEQLHNVMFPKDQRHEYTNAKAVQP